MINDDDPSTWTWSTPEDGLGPCPPDLEYPPLSGIHYDYELAQNEPDEP